MSADHGAGGQPAHASESPSDWLVRHGNWLAGRQTALDVAAGHGRHVRWLASHGLTVTAVDRDATAAAAWPPKCEAIVADLERDGWPFGGRVFDVVVVTNYLWRPLLPAIIGAVAAGGVLLYETFARGQETIGRPSNPDFLLEPGELLRATEGLRTRAYEDLRVDAPPRFVQRVVATRSAAPDGTPR